ncbi:MAG: fatty acid desaturase, partial [Planctomycetaceae bacterium]|nr:fatty acid desaturase [Planctomycetaceae bacterium]
LFPSPRANVLYGRMAGILLFIPYTAFRETHRTHHAYLNTPRDLEMWPYSNPAYSRWFRRAFVVFELLCGWIASPLIFSRIYFVHSDRLSESARTMIRREYLVMLLFWALVAATVGWLLATGRVAWTVVLLAYVLPSLIAPGINAARKFIEHLGLASTDPVQGTRTVLGPGVVTRLCSYFNFDIAIHGPHHRYPRAKHYELPERLRQLQAGAEPANQPPVFETFAAALWATLPCLWRCPGVGETVRRDLGQTTLTADGDSPGSGRREPLAPDHWDCTQVPAGRSSPRSDVHGLVGDLPKSE